MCDARFGRLLRLASATFVFFAIFPMLVFKNFKLRTCNLTMALAFKSRGIEGHRNTTLGSKTRAARRIGANKKKPVQTKPRLNKARTNHQPRRDLPFRGPKLICETLQEDDGVEMR